MDKDIIKEKVREIGNKYWNMPEETLYPLMDDVENALRAVYKQGRDDLWSVYVQEGGFIVGKREGRSETLREVREKMTRKVKDVFAAALFPAEGNAMDWARGKILQALASLSDKPKEEKK